MAQRIAGWDIGGAHVKLALLDEHGGLSGVEQRPCPLWKGCDYLAAVLAELDQAYGLADYRHAVTMTGELADGFTSREQGVRAIVATIGQRFGYDRIEVFAGRAGFLGGSDVAPADTLAIASANWLASVFWLAEQLPDALFVDIGSTTTDLLLIENGCPRIEGYTDYQRLISGELLYTGVVRTSVMALADTAEFNGRQQGLMAEHFATTADIYRVTGDLQEHHDQTESADGAEKTPQASARRLSRLTGYDFVEADWPLWQAFAARLKDVQKQKVTRASLARMQRATRLPVWVGAGVGRFLIREIADDLGYAYRDFSELLAKPNGECSRLDAADCAPAVAVALLADRRRHAGQP
ncbi:hydantoinase/oxoprolinase family protein [Methylomonas sp. MED-D]|uniref:hydantoinase/oxoprolinase family protein n=1 Tax=Methylomonas sp. MED-D TaxID=3418768 RepID=UPI003CFC5535